MKTTFLWGDTGSGKTLRAVKMLLIDYLLGRDIWSNSDLYFPCKNCLHISKSDTPNFCLYCGNKIYNKIDLVQIIDMALNEQYDIMDNSPKTFFLDEIQTAFDGRRAMTKNNIDFSLFISQCRKRGINVVYTSQYISGADPRIRVLTDKLIRCIPIKDYNNLGLSNDPQNPEPIKFKFYIVNPKIPDMVIKKTWNRNTARFFYRFYNTYQIIRQVEGYQ